MNLDSPTGEYDAGDYVSYSVQVTNNGEALLMVLNSSSLVIQ